MAGVLVLVEHAEGSVKKVTLELLTAARAIGDPIAVVVGAPGSGIPNAALWQNDMLINLGLLPGDLGGIASGINDAGQVVGSNFDSQGNWNHAFIWQNNVMTDLNALFPKSSNLFATMANKINEHGQISGMAIVRSGPDMGNIHAFIATPVRQSIGRSVAEVAPTHPKSSLPAETATTTSRPMIWRFIWASALSSPVRLCKYCEVGSCGARRSSHLS
jgi:probable HAF family extracellular repeat protein